MPSLWSIIVFLIACSIGVHAGNPRIESRKSRLVVSRQDQNAVLTGPKSLKEVTTTKTEAGTRIETCIITLTPVTSNGVATVRETRSCTSTFSPNVPSNNASSNNTPAGSSSSIVNSATTFSTTSSTASPSSTFSIIDNTKVPSPTSISSLPTAEPNIAGVQQPVAQPAAPIVPISSAVVTSISPVSVISSEAPVTSSLASSSSAVMAPSSTIAPISVIGTSSIAAVVSTSTTTPVGPSGQAAAVEVQAVPSAPSSSDIGGGVISAEAISPVSTAVSSSSSISAMTASAAQDQSSSTTAVAAADATLAAASSSSTTIKLPGTKLSVLPIGLGVFGGISAIALIVVGYVMWERMKYRNSFRVRKKLSEKGAQPAYGGMTERV